MHIPPNIDATIIIDKFHVVRMANDALERVRKSLRRQLTDKERRPLKNDRFILLKREHKLPGRQKFLLCFEALRARILFGEGAFKTETNKKHFRQRSTQLKSARISQVREPATLTQYDKYYGVDIDALTELVKDGLLS